MDRDVRRRLRALRGRWHNLTSRDIERAAAAAGWVHDRTTGSHMIYVKEGFWANLSIPRGKLKGRTALQLLNLIEASLYEEAEEVGYE